ncbi:MAG: tyrosine-type recombinase/integrase [Kiritimatiellae bacterium]|nr:tyrosine-type recombinase/integrase [Kiritimatiellia bacterium]
METILTPPCGFLYKRVNGKYCPATSPKDGTFYYRFPLPSTPGGHVSVSLRTRDAEEASRRALVLTTSLPTLSVPNLAEAISILLRVIKSRTLPASPREPGTVAVAAQSPVPSSSAPEPQLTPFPRVALSDIWFLFTQKYQVASSSLGCYRQILRNFQNWTVVEYADEITRPLAEEYTRHLFASKISARTELNTLKRIWQTIWPDAPNPWNTGLRLQPKERTGVFRYRRLSLDEARAFHRQLRRERDQRRSPDRGRIIRCRPGDADRRKVIDAQLYDDLHDALYFAWNYGMRVGSLANLRWEDFSTKLNADFFLHIPPKTKGTKPWPLEIPYLPEIVTLLVNRMVRYPKPPTGWLFPCLHETYTYHPTRITSVVKRVMIAAGVRDDHRGRASMHSFRASFITRMDEAGCPSGITDSITGHAPQTMHDLYSHSCITVKRRWLIRAIPPLSDKKGEGMGR